MIETEETKYKPKTSCEGCVFSEMRDGKQIGCKLNRLKKFEQNNGVLIKPDGDSYNYTIEGRNCSAYRKEEWARDKNNLVDILKAELLIRPEIIITCDCNDVESELHETIESAVNQSVEPSKIVLINNYSAYKPSFLLAILNEQPLAYRLDNIEKKNISLEQCLNMSVKKCESSHFIIVESGVNLPEHYINDINIALNEDMERFVAILPNEGLTGLFTSRDLYLHYQSLQLAKDGVDAIGIIEKLRMIGESYDQNHMLVNYADFVSRY